jgi:putative transposase
MLVVPLGLKKKIKKMANSYSQIYIQAVFAVKYRDSVIHNSWKNDLHSNIGQLITECDCKSLIVNGVEDHIHCLIGLKPTQAFSELMQIVKGRSSKWINDNKLTSSRFEWQPGFGAFSYSRSHVNNVYKYIQNQEEHHKKTSFKKEYLDLLQKFEVEYDEKYLFEELI